ncbi:MAG: alpha/beta hydrolase [Anaerolineae bacterium]
MTSEVDFRVLQADPSPFFLEAGPVGVLLLHGFSGTPREMWPLGTYLHERGLTVSAPLLPGHGNTLADMNRANWRDWVAGVEAAYANLKQKTAQDRSTNLWFIAGFSLGSLLTLWMAEHHDDIAGIALYAPALWIADWRLNLAPLLRSFVHSYPQSGESDLHNPEAEQWMGGFARYPVGAAAELWHLRRHVLHDLSRVQTPTLVVYSEGDRSIHPRSGPETVRRLSQQVPVESMVLHDSGHAVVADREWETVAEATYRFVQRYAEDL